MRLILGGALGRMGRTVRETAKGTGVEIVCGVDAAVTACGELPVVADYALVTAEADMILDFSRPSALGSLLRLAVSRKIPAVLCATGYSEEDLAAIAKASETIPILRSANMSLGVNVMLELAEKAARALKGYDIEIVEKHHRNKADAPSGTALMLLDAVKAGREEETKPVFGREGKTGVRTTEEVALHAVRGGTLVGEHEVGYYGPGEHILLTHRAEDRSLFAQGALKAAAWLEGRPAGQYSMRDVVREMLEN